MKGVFVCVAIAAALFGAAVVPCFAAEIDGAARVQADDPEAKGILVDKIMTEAEHRSAKDWDPAARASLRGVLLGRSLQELSEAAEGERALEALLGGKALGSNLNDWVFTPVPACRILDTRPASGAQGAGTGPYLPGTPHSFDVAAGASGCTVPFPVAKAVSLNFVGVSATGLGNLRAWPYDTTNPPQPSTSVLNYNAGFNTANGVVIAICNTATATAGNCNDDLFVETNVSSAHVVIDVYGYWAAPVATALECQSVYAAAGTVVAAGTDVCTDPPACPAGYTPTAPLFDNSGFAGLVLSQMNLDPTSGGILICGRNTGAGTPSFFPGQRCCRVPGR